MSSQPAHHHMILISPLIKQVGCILSCKVNTNKLIVSRTAYGMQIYVELHIYKCPHRRQKLTLLFLFTDLFHKEIFLTLRNNRKVNTLHLLRRLRKISLLHISQARSQTLCVVVGGGGGCQIGQILGPFIITRGLSCDRVGFGNFWGVGGWGRVRWPPWPPPPPPPATGLYL